MATFNNSVRWSSVGLRQIAVAWVIKMHKQKQESSYISTWWSYVFTWNREIPNTIKDFITGNYKFSPMINYRFSDQIVTVWGYKDKLLLTFLRKIIMPVIRNVISSNCYHLNGPTGIKKAINCLSESLDEGQYRYFIRADIKNYYASVTRNILVKQVKSYFTDFRLRIYVENIITTAIDDGGEVKIPKLGIPRSSLSPIFGALYLSKLDLVFKQSTGVSYYRFMDDIVILAKTKRQFLNAKKRMQQILLSLKLKLSRSKTRMGELTKGFHFLGIDFAVSRNQQDNKIHVTKSLHSRTYRRALNKINAMEEGAVNPVKVLHYLFRWATWWRAVLRDGMYADLVEHQAV